MRARAQARSQRGRGPVHRLKAVAFCYSNAYLCLERTVMDAERLFCAMALFGETCWFGSWIPNGLINQKALTYRQTYVCHSASWCTRCDAHLIKMKEKVEKDGRIVTIRHFILVYTYTHNPEARALWLTAVFQCLSMQTDFTISILCV